MFINYLLKNIHEQNQKYIKNAQVSFPLLKVLFSIFHTTLIITKQNQNPWTHHLIMNLIMTSSTPHFIMSKHQHKPTARMEANNALPIIQPLENTKLNLVKISL